MINAMDFTFMRQGGQYVLDGELRLMGGPLLPETVDMNSLV